MDTEQSAQAPKAEANASTAKAEKRRKDVAFVLDHPVFLEVNEPIRKMRSNLMIASVISIFSISMGLGISSSTSVSGVQFTGLTESKISIGLLCITSYMLVHFAWSSWDGFQEWMIRCSGTGLAFIKPDRDVDPRQVSLMTWWTMQVDAAGRQQDAMNLNLALFEKAIAPLNRDPASRGRELQDRTARHEMIQNFQNYSSGMMALYKYGVSTSNERTLKDQLERFELIFKRFLVSQNRRWIIVEFLFPVLLGLIAIGLLLTDLNLNPFFSFSII